jgi:hypothetical protein
VGRAQSHRFRRASLGIAATTVFLALAAAHQSTAASTVTTSAGKTSIVRVTAGKPSEYAFRISPTSVKRGTVIFKITNLGKLPHSFSINGRSSAVLQPNRSATLTVVFKKPARYTFTDACVQELEDPSALPCGGGVLKVI